MFIISLPNNIVVLFNLFSSVKYLIECGYQSVCDLSLIDNIKVHTSICLIHINQKIISWMKNDCHIHPSQLYSSYLLFILEVKLIMITSNNNKLQ